MSLECQSKASGCAIRMAMLKLMNCKNLCLAKVNLHQNDDFNWIYTWVLCVLELQMGLS